MKLLKRLVCISLLCMLLLPPLLVYADVDENEAQNAATEDYKSWRQGDKRWKDYVMSPGKDKIGSSGCLVTSLAVLMAYSGTMSKDFQPLKFYQWLSSNKGFNESSCLNWGSIVNYNEDFMYSKSASVSSIDDAKVKIKAAYAEGVYIIAHVEGSTGSGHWVAILNGDTLSIVDPASDCTVLTDKYTSITEIALFTCSVPSNKATGVVNSAVANKTSGSLASALAKSWYEESHFFDNTCLEDTRTFVFPSVIDLSQDDKSSVALWKQDVDSNSSNINTLMRVIVMFIGILIVVYSSILYIAYWFDRINNFIEISLLMILTFNKLQISPDDTTSTFSPKTQGLKVVTHKNIIFICLVGILIGILILSGRVYSLIGVLINSINKIL